MPPRGRKKRGTLPARQLAGRKYLKLLTPLLKELRELYPHPNRLLCYDDVVVAYLLAFFNPMVNSLRLIEDLSEIPAINAQLHVRSICKSTLSDAQTLFDPDHLQPLIEQLRPRLPQLAHQDRELAHLLDKVVALDGSFFRLAADVEWGFRKANANNDGRSFVRLNLAYALRTGLPAGSTGLPTGCSIDGGPVIDEAGHRVNARHEGAAFAPMIQAGEIYLFDGGVVSFAFLSHLLESDADFVASLREQVHFQSHEERPLEKQAIDAGVISDHIGVLPGSPHRTPPTQTLREVRVRYSDRNGKTSELRLLTSRLDLPAHLVAALYRYRWQIELFFRWLKVTAGLAKLTSHSKNGILLSFYVAIIAQMLICLRTQTPVNRYGLMLLGLVASGQASVQEILPTLEKRHRQQKLERERLARKRAAQKAE